jgi:ribonuclease HI
VDPIELHAVLRRLLQARPGPGVLHLPANLPADRALCAIRELVEALRGRTADDADEGGPPEPPCAAAGTAPTRLRAHIDGGSRGNPGPAGIGVLFLTPAGEVVERLHRYIGHATNNTAEYRALLLALGRALELGCRELEVLSDSELLVRQLRGAYRVRHPEIRRLFAAAQEEIRKLDRFSVQHVPRAQNAEADALANRGIDEGGRPPGRLAHEEAP